MAEITSRGLAATTAAALALILVSCTQSEQTTTTLPIPPTTLVAPTTANPADVPPAASLLPDNLPAGTVLVEPAPAVAGDFSVLLADGEPALEVLRVLGRDDSHIAAPSGASLGLEACRFVGPGTYVYEFTAAGNVTYPYVATITAGRVEADIGYTFRVDLAVPGPGSHRLIESRSEMASADWDSWLKEGGHVRPAIGRQQHPQGWTCSLAFADSPQLSSAYLTREWQSLEVTAPPRTVEGLGQAAFTDGTDAALAPLATLYGDAVPMYAQSWFVPANPEPLQLVTEDLSEKGCLELEFVYTTYMIIQQLNCRPVDSEAVYQAGRRWVAHASDGLWTIRALAESRELALELVESLQAHHLVRHRPTPPGMQERDQAAPLAAERRIPHSVCDQLPQDLARTTDVAPVATACADLTRGIVTLAVIRPNRRTVTPAGTGPPVGYLCVVTATEGRTAFNCGPEDGVFDRPDVQGNAATVVVPAETDEVSALLTTGQVVVAIPVNGLAYLNWSADSGGLVEIVARRGDTYTVLDPAVDFDAP